MTGEHLITPSGTRAFVVADLVSRRHFSFRRQRKVSVPAQGGKLVAQHDRTDSTFSNLLQLHPTMLNHLLPSALPKVTRTGLRNASRLGLRHFSGAPAALPPQGWTPTPYVTETIVSHSRLRQLIQYSRSLIISGGGWRTRTSTLSLLLLNYTSIQRTYLTQ